MASSAHLLGPCVGAGSWTCPPPTPEETCPTGAAAGGEGDTGINDKGQVLLAFPSWAPSFCSLPSMTDKAPVLGTISLRSRTELRGPGCPQGSGLREPWSPCGRTCPEKSCCFCPGEGLALCFQWVHKKVKREMRAKLCTAGGAECQGCFRGKSLLGCA